MVISLNSINTSSSQIFSLSEISSRTDNTQYSSLTSGPLKSFSSLFHLETLYSAAQLHSPIVIPLTCHLVVVTLTSTALMPSYLRICAIVGIILSTSLLSICTSVNTTLGLIYNADDHRGLVKDDNITAKLEDFARRASGLNAITLMAPLFRNTIMVSVRTDPNTYLRLDARGGECQCADVNSKWRSHTPPREELE